MRTGSVASSSADAKRSFFPHPGHWVATEVLPRRNLTPEDLKAHIAEHLLCKPRELDRWLAGETHDMYFDDLNLIAHTLDIDEVLLLALASSHKDERPAALSSRVKSRARRR